MSRDVRRASDKVSYSVLHLLKLVNLVTLDSFTWTQHMLYISNWPKSMQKVIIVNVQCRGSHLVLFIRIFIIRSVKYLP